MARLTDGSAIRDLREVKGLSQRDLAAQAGISAAALCHVEKGRNGLSVPAARRVADALGVHLDSITTRVPDKVPA